MMNRNCYQSEKRRSIIGRVWEIREGRTRRAKAETMMMILIIIPSLVTIILFPKIDTYR